MGGAGRRGLGRQVLYNWGGSRKNEGRSRHAGAWFLVCAGADLSGARTYLEEYNMMKMQMKFRVAGILSMAIMAVMVGSAARGDALADDYSKDKVKPAVNFQVRAFDLRDVRVLEGPFKQHQEL